MRSIPKLSAFKAATCVAAVIIVGMARVASAADSSWLDIEGQIQYAFYIEDARALVNLSEQLSRTDAAPDPLRGYYAGLAHYRLSLLWATREKERARDASESCVASLEAALEKQANFAEALALQSACLRALVALKPWKTPLAGPKSTAQIERAVQLAPKNPRVLLLQAIEGSAVDSTGAAKADEQQLRRLHKVVAAFEIERQGLDKTPGWGAAEAYAYLGRTYLDKGDLVAARDALERALLIAPDFVLARRLMSKVTVG